MAYEPELNATNDPMWLYVVLTARQIRNDSLRTLMQAWADDRERAIEKLDQLAAGLNRTEGGWDTAVYDLEADLQLDDAEVAMDADRARALAAELLAAADRTLASRREAERPLMFPHQQDRRHAA